jgi:N6-adenosine-specific RNA methylase IME4
VILADPPWAYRNGGNGAAANHYPTMTAASLCALPVAELAGRDAVLLLWATWPQMREAMDLVDAWGFRYVTGLPWIKVRGHPQADLWGEIAYRPTWGTGFWVRSCSEPLLIAKRGNARPPLDPPLGLLSRNFQHSRKPDNVYDYAEALPGPYLELFARRPRPGWDAWGNEVEGSIELAGAGVALSEPHKEA